MLGQDDLIGAFLYRRHQSITVFWFY